VIETISGVKILVSYSRLLPTPLRQGAILVAMMILDGIDLAMIVPLVELPVGLDGSGSEVSIIRWAESGFDAVGLELSI
jgi:hypothetical protein